VLFFDTNVLIYMRDPRDARKQAAARHWLDRASDDNLHVVSPQVIGEFAHVMARREYGLAPDALRIEISKLSRFSRGETSTDVLLRGADLRKRTGFQFWDCVIAINAIDAGCRYLLSEDYEHQRKVDGVTIINPFLETPEPILAALRQN
jgi:predicted nucleic acid-binding protein